MERVSVSGSPECSKGPPECSKGSPECPKGPPECPMGPPECPKEPPECSKGPPECSKGSPECSKGLPECPLFQLSIKDFPTDLSRECVVEMFEKYGKVHCLSFHPEDRSMAIIVRKVV